VLKNSVAAKFAYYMRDLAKIQYNMWWPKAPLDEFFNTIGGKCEFAARARQPRPNAESRHYYGLETAIPSALPQSGFEPGADMVKFFLTELFPTLHVAVRSSPCNGPSALQ
jgi:hypothetical protein